MSTAQVSSVFQRTSVIAELVDQEEQRGWQREMKERQSPQVARKLRVEHVGGEGSEAATSQKIDGPCELERQQADRPHAGAEAAIAQQGGKREDKADVGKPHEVRRSIGAPIDDRDDRHG